MNVVLFVQEEHPANNVSCRHALGDRNAAEHPSLLDVLKRSSRKQNITEITD